MVSKFGLRKPKDLMVWEREGLELHLSPDQVKQGHHQGECDADIEALMKDKHINVQLANLKPEKVRAFLKPFGAWAFGELQDDEANLARVLWIACGDLQEEKQYVLLVGNLGDGMKFYGPFDSVSLADDFATNKLNAEQYWVNEMERSEWS